MQLYNNPNPKTWVAFSLIMGVLLYLLGPLSAAIYFAFKSYWGAACFSLIVQGFLWYHVE